jgi:hypothetical protein
VRRVGFELRRVWTALMGHKHRFAGAIRRPAAPAAATAATAGVAAGVRAASASASTLGDGGGAIPLSVFTLRHEALHFITCLDAYVTSQVLEGGFDELMRDTARAACSIDGLRAAHEAYARRIAARCLLTPASSFSAPSSASAPGGGGGGAGPRGGPPTAAALAAKLLDTIFNTLLDFCHIVLTHLATAAEGGAAGEPAAAAPLPGGAAPLFPASVLQRVAACRRDLHKQLRFLHTGLTGMSAQGAGFAHIDDLLARLNVTDFYARL